MDRIDEIQTRKAEIKAATEAPEKPDNAEELLEEFRSLVAEEQAIYKAEEERKAKLAEEFENSEPIENITFKEATIMAEEKRVYGLDSVEYRNAFMAMLNNTATVEQRSIVADTSAYGDGLSLPVALDTAIWNQVATAHPIVNDVVRLNSGIAIKVTQMTPAAISKKKDSDASTEETYTTAEITLVGADYHTYIKLSYAEAKMSQGAMETYLVNDIATVIGEAVAKDIFARILTDAAAQSVTSTGDMFADIKTALGKAKTAASPVIYAPASSYYEIVGAVNAAGGNPFNIGNVLGCQVKLDNAATKVTVVDPSLFVLNVISDVNVKTQDDVAEAKYVIGGYMRCEGCLRKTTAAAFIA